MVCILTVDCSVCYIIEGDSFYPLHVLARTCTCTCICTMEVVVIAFAGDVEDWPVATHVYNVHVCTCTSKATIICRCLI